MDAGTVETFAEKNFGGIDLGDKRRTERLVSSVDRIGQHPGGTLPDKLENPKELHAFYDLMNRPEVTHEKLIARHAEQTRRQIAHAEGDVLLLHDQTELDYTTRKRLAERLGQIGKGSRRGYICHNSLAVLAETGETLGLVWQILHHRASVGDGETKKERRERDDRESRLWIKGVEAAGPAPAGVRVIDISDRGSDTFEYMAREVSLGRHFVLRVAKDRRFATEQAGHRYLFDLVRNLTATDTDTIAVPATKTVAARQAQIRISFSPITLTPPRKKAGEYVNRSLSLWVVRIAEVNPPSGVEPLEWILIGNVPVENASQARDYQKWYQHRWIIEEFHKGKKTGCGIETLQFDTLEALEPTIAILSVIATQLLRLRDAARRPDAATRFATEVVHPVYVETLAAYYGAKLGVTPSVLKFYMFVARLGGHQNRKGDGFPGWITLWRGWMKLEQQVRGFLHGKRHTHESKRCA